MDIDSPLTTSDVNDNKEFFHLHAPFIKFCQIQTHRVLRSGIDSDIIRVYDYSKMSVPDLNIIIPVYGRKNHLYFSTKCLLEQIRQQTSSNVNIIVCEMSSEAQHKDLCRELGIEYLHIKSGMFNKSLAMTRAANLFPAEHFMFYDVDLLVGDRWLQNCLDTIKQISSKSSSWVCQPVPGRRILYISEQDTNSLFLKEKTFKELQQKDHYIQPEWYKGNYPPGGIILLSANLLYAVQGYDPALYWGYSPEDLFFLERCIQYSDFSDLLSWQFLEDKSIDVYHMYHTNSEDTNMAYEHMVFASDILKLNEELSSWYSSNKLRWDSFPMWRQANFREGNSRFPETINSNLITVFRESKNLEQFQELASKLIEEKLPKLKEDNPPLFKIYLAYINYLMKNGASFFKHFRGLY